MSGLTKTWKRRPLSWWRSYGNLVDGRPNARNVIAYCSNMHASTIQHNIQPDGALVAPEGKSPSMHCGRCDETLPLRLDGWTPDDPAACPGCRRTCDRSDLEANGMCWGCQR